VTRVDLHPEDLFDHLRRGELRDDERERLQRHCEVCSACAFELHVVEGNAYDSAPTADDHAVASRALVRMLSGDAAEEIAPVRVTSGGQVWLRAAALVLAGVLVGGSVSAAALANGETATWVTWIGSWVAWTAPTEKPDTKTAPSVARQTRARHAPNAPNGTSATHVEANIAAPAATPPTIQEVREFDPMIPPSSVPTLSVAATSPIVPQVERRARVATAVHASTATEANTTPVAAAEPTVEPAVWLFRAASRARSEGRVHEAAALYAALQRDYAGSEVEVVTRVAFGRLALGQLNDPQRALAAFDSYLDARPEGALAEEARGGRVSALRKLGRDTEARDAAQKLRTLHPHTLYVDVESTAP